MKKVVLEIIEKAENIGAFVDCLASDMGPNNVSMMNKFGFGVEIDKKGRINIKNKIRHPTDPSRWLYLVYDVPHVEKNLANGWRNYRTIKMHKDLCKKYEFSAKSSIEISHVSYLLLPAFKNLKEL